MEVNNGPKLLFDLLLKTVNFSPMDVEERSLFRCIPFLFHELLSVDGERVFFEMLVKELLDCMGRKPRIEHRLLDTMGDWVRIGRPLDMGVLTDMRHFVNTVGDSASQQKTLEIIDWALECHSPVIGRWRVESPRSDLLLWRAWSAKDIALSLTELCLPFFQLRPIEFYEEKQPGKHLQMLNKRSKSLSEFVALTILAASAQNGTKAGASTLQEWLEVALELEKLRNYHMMFAVQCGLSKHQVDRVLKDFKVKKKWVKFKKHLDEFFDPTTRMGPAIEAMKDMSTPQIPCIFWFVQKSTLLKETPLLIGDEINLDRAKAAWNVFASLCEMQIQRYGRLGVEENMLWYFMRLELDTIQTSDDDLYTVSDMVKKKLKTSVGASLKDHISLFDMSDLIDELKSSETETDLSSDKS